MSTNLGKPLRLRNDGGAQLELERSGTTKKFEVNASGNVELDGTLIPTALTTASATITGGSINGTTIGATTASTGAFTTITGSGNMNIDSGTLFVDSANDRVGMGTTTPSERLELLEATNNAVAKITTTANTGRSQLFLQGRANGTSDVFFTNQNSSTVGLIRYNHTSNFLEFDTNSAERMRIDSAGNVGIGTTDPGVKLNVVNNDLISNRRAYASFATAPGLPSTQSEFFYGAGVGEVIITAGATDRPAVLSLGGAVDAGTTLGAINFFRSGNTNGYRAIATIDVESTTTGTANRHGGILVFRTKPNNDTSGGITERMRITSAGNVGIGTTSPAAKLEISGAQTAIFDNGGANFDFLALTLRNSGTAAFTTHNAQLVFDVAGTGGQAVRAKIIGGKTDTAQQNGFLAFQTLGSGTLTERMRITSAGDVGIGTTAPAAALDVTPPATTPAIAMTRTSRVYCFRGRTVNSGQSLRVTNITNVVGRASAMFYCKISANRTTSNTDGEHWYAIFAFRVFMRTNGGTANIEGLTSIAAYGISVSTAVTFVDVGSGEWYFQIASPSGDTTRVSLEMEVLHGAAADANVFSDTFTATVV